LPLNELSAGAAIGAVRAGSASVEAIVQTTFDRIDEREEDLRAWAWLDSEAALAAARAIDQRKDMGPLAGVTVGVKDIIDTAGMPTSYGSPIYAAHRPAADAYAVIALRNADAVIAGKTVTTEFASAFPSKTRHPHDANFTPGGSSSGSAAAVAAHMVSAALGTQTAGSVIRPASFCGVVGFKPSFGWLNRAGVKPFAESLDTIGVFVRRVADAGLVAGALDGRTDWMNVEPLSKAPRLALCRTPYWGQAQDDGRAALDRAARLLAEAGASVAAFDLPASFAVLTDVHATIMWWEGRRAFAHELAAAPSQVSEVLRGLLAKADDLSPRDHDRAQLAAARARTEIDGAFEDFDAILTLAAPGSPPPLSEGSTGRPIFNATWTLLHLPCITVPGLSGDHGLPIGTQLVGRRGGEARLLAVAAWVESAFAPP